jgi:hypothetical protein
MIYGWVEKLIVAAVIIIISAVAVASMKEEELKTAFDLKCRDAGGIPLRSTYHYDAKENKIHYVCLKITSVMDVE